MNFRRRFSLVGLWVAAAMGLLLGSGPTSQADEGLWRALRDGQAAVLMRHALAPGAGDPARFSLEDCATQRNLSNQGRQQARKIGDAFRANGISAATVRSSRWCRCLETARLLDLGPVQPFPPLDSFFAARERGPAQTAELREFLGRPHSGPPRVLVTHQVNITALTGVFPNSGEMIVIQPAVDGEVRVLGRLNPGH